MTPQLVPSSDARRAAREFLAREVPGSGPLIVAHTGAGKAPNIWPARHFIRVLQELQAELGARVVLTEGPSDAAIVAPIAAALEHATRWRRPLNETFGLLAAAQLVLCNDTGMAHVAAAVGTPTVVVFGPTDPARWRPPGEHVRAVSSLTRRVDDVDPEAVLAAARALLGTDGAHAARSIE
jgi:ADP-heptose:LPS heptosyltransferase